MTEYALAAANLRRLVGVEGPTHDYTLAVLGELELLADRLRKADREPLHQRQQAQNTSSLLVVEGQPALPLGVELFLVQGDVVAMERGVVSRDPVEKQTALPCEELGAPPMLCSR